MGVLVSGLTTITGFGTLMMAHHRGIYGLGLLLTLGSVTSLIAALVVLPVLLRLWHPGVRSPVPPEPRVEAVPVD
jgi:predicted RND superfamily exporter protein